MISCGLINKVSQQPSTTINSTVYSNKTTITKPTIAIETIGPDRSVSVAWQQKSNKRVLDSHQKESGNIEIKVAALIVNNNTGSLYCQQ